MITELMTRPYPLPRTAGDAEWKMLEQALMESQSPSSSLGLSPHLTRDLLVLLFSYLGKAGRGTAATACRQFNDIVKYGRQRDLFRDVVQSVAAGCAHSMACTAAGEVYSWGSGQHGQLGHGGPLDERIPRVIQALILL